MNHAHADWLEQAAALPLCFAQVREDARIDLAVLDRLRPGARVAMVASGGCTAAALAASPRVAAIHVVDPNPAQLALCRLKLHWLAESAADRLALLGHAPLPLDQRRDQIAAGLQALELPEHALGPLDLVATFGPDQAGRYEREFAALRACLQPVSAELDSLLRLRDPAEQSRRADTTPLGTALDRAFDEAMSQPILVRLFGAAATQNRIQPFARHFAQRTRHVLATLPAADNPYLWQVLKGEFPPGVVSPWLLLPPCQPANVTWSCQYMTDCLGASPEKFDLVHLSNILDWLSLDDAQHTLALAFRALRPGGYCLVRQLNSTLDIPALGDGFRWLADEAASLHAQDRSYFYRALHLGQKP